MTARFRPKITLAETKVDWHHPTHIRFGPGRIKELPEVCWQLGISAPLIVTDQRVSKLPFVKSIIRLNKEESIFTTVFSDIFSEPDFDTVKKGAEVLRQGRHDGIIAIGGGSALDAAKAICLAAAAGPSRIWEFTSGSPGHAVIYKTLIPIIAVPTTAGTGSEVDANAVIKDTISSRKISIFHPDLMPKVVIADPELTRGLIPFLTAATGMDALSHNIEALSSPVFHPVLDGVAMQGIFYIKEGLLPAFYSGRNIKARTYTMAASIMGAIAFDKGLGAGHAVSHAIGGMFKVHHGRVMGTLLPYVLILNRARIKDKMSRAARYLDLPGQDFTAFVNWVTDLKIAMGMPANLKELGIRKQHIPDIAQKALEDANIHTNPVKMDPKKMKELLAHALKG
ncbi:iron-containing alcohol dehydrogenase [Desulfotignum phosphitoxidans]|uniref:Alcohol dehydrogenase AdhB n=1 Tax=Desulfotignum phosphitoxidans DSM 13687 TaxID=1286635 RepID=S0G4R4_9BACT|nr:iron-containing alcohol dehydrogenase [Desulfotignum phosphitoxidans]EMS80639.1 alcohol dehydrogenase AdhB [Desulfotignum phosphitoxidans DSM 13687]